MPCMIDCCHRKLSSCTADPCSPRTSQADGAELLIALTHMREPNDRKLAAEVPEFHLVLGGHDHHYVSAFIEPHNNLMVKSGTDFRDMSLIEVEFPNGSTTDPKMSVERLVIDGSVPEDPAAKEVRVGRHGRYTSANQPAYPQPADHLLVLHPAARSPFHPTPHRGRHLIQIVDEYMKLMGEKMDEVVVETLEPLDGRFQTVRTRESNLGNFVCDVWRKAANAQIAILNSGSLR